MNFERGLAPTSNLLLEGPGKHLSSCTLGPLYSRPAHRTLRGVRVRVAQHHNITTQVWPQGHGHQAAVLRIGIRPQPLGRVEGPIPNVSSGLLMSEVGLPSPPRILLSSIKGGIYDGIFKRFAQDQTGLLSLTTMNVPADRNVCQLLERFSAGKAAIQTDRQREFTHTRTHSNTKL